MKLKLKSNFWQPWMAAFDSDGQEFRLVTTDGPNRIEQHKIFKKASIPTPLFGTYNFFLKNQYDPQKKVVVYDDINAHLGEGKRLVVFGELKDDEKPICLCEYIDSPISSDQKYVSKSTRLLCVGDYTFQYDYISFDDWRSNNGEGDITESKMIYTPAWRCKIPYAFFAIDMVGPDSNLKAIDFNIAPGIQSNFPLPATQMVLSIKSWLQKYANNTEE